MISCTPYMRSIKNLWRQTPKYCFVQLISYYSVAFSGDLKTFLLARRHLVGQETKEAEDIMPEALTRMALDVCYGLKYLTDLKYVHRYVLL